MTRRKRTLLQWLQLFFPAVLALSSVGGGKFNIRVHGQSVRGRFPEPTPESERLNALGETLRWHVAKLRSAPRADIVFLVDSSASVGADNFVNELRFVRKLLADFTVSFERTRVALVTFSSKQKVVREVDQITAPSTANHKCALQNSQLIGVKYAGGGTFTLGAMQEAMEILKFSRDDAAKAVFLVTDGYSNGGDPRPCAKMLRDSDVTIYTFGIRNGNVRELQDMASDPNHEHCYILDSFEEFEALARRALHEDMHVGPHQLLNATDCDSLCPEGEGCCHPKALCSCGTSSGQYTCLCPKGHFGSGLRDDCHPCPRGTYQPVQASGGVSICVPCPHAHQNSAPGSTSVAQCHCKRGYSPEGGTCKVVQCDELAPPANGYMVNADCEVVFNAACGFRCNPGFRLIGNSIRVCQHDGTWSGSDPSCEKKKCSPLEAPFHGLMSCSGESFDFETTCEFECERGYALIGSRKRTCLSIALWDGLPALCRPVTCPPLVVPEQGAFSPPHCGETKSSFGEVCTLQCARGYRLRGPATRQCLGTGAWSEQDVAATCVDATPPTIHNCPEDIAVDSEPGYGEAIVDWEMLEATDKSGASLFLNVAPAVMPPHLFPIGEHQVTYWAEDAVGNTAFCNFTVTVADVEPPSVDGCPDPAEAFSDGKASAYVSWEEPLFSDNSGGEVTVSQSHSPGEFPVGETAVTYVATDGSGNNASCVIKVVVRDNQCDQPSSPANGKADCRQTSTGINCTVSCSEGYDLEPDSPREFACSFSDGWSPFRPASFPDCSESVPPASAAVDTRLFYSAPPGVSCTDQLTQSKLRDHIQMNLAMQASDCPDGVGCAIQDLLINCPPEHPPEGRRRRKRSQEYDIGVSFRLAGALNETAPQDSRLLTAMKDLLTRIKDAVLRKELDVTLDEGYLSARVLEDYEKGLLIVCPVGSVSSAERCVKCPAGTFYETFNTTHAMCLPCPVSTFQPDEGQEVCLACPNRTSTLAAKTKSVDDCKGQCFPGTYSSTGLQPCRSCRKSLYQPDYGMTDCLRCPDGRRSKRRGSVSDKECRALCPPGFVSKNGVEPCHKCPEGFYQPKHGQRACRRCPEDIDDVAFAQVDIFGHCNGTVSPNEKYGSADLIEANPCLSQPCSNGATCVVVPAGFVCVCPVLFSGPYCERRLSPCSQSPCQFGGTCRDKVDGYRCDCPPGRTGTDCTLDVDECASSPCQHNGTCVNTVGSFVCGCAQGFEGSTCSVDQDECASFPCMNGGTCLDREGNFSCVCPASFAGRYCESELDACRGNGCANGATCINMGSHYRCICRPGYEGQRCKEDVDECTSVPCNVGSTCVNLPGSFECLCPPNLTGRLCEAEADPRFKLHFSGKNVFDRASVRAPRKPMRQLTACMWITTTDKYNYGTPFSYATDDVDNMLTLTDYSGFVLYVNGERVITDVKANDGYWHHICFSWSSEGGIWSIFKDGRLAESGAGLATGCEIPANGSLVLGQEQDRRGGGFSISESFAGELTQVNVWSTVFEVDEVASLLTQCEMYYGDAVAWADFRERLDGHISATSWTFCQGCHPPPAPLHGIASFSTTTTGSVATYSCDPGHVLDRATTRRCLASGEWSHPIPVCVGVPCGIPPDPTNGSVRGSAFRYSGKVTYVCVSGYRISGSSERHCQEDGQWSGAAPSCEAVTCQGYPKVINGIAAVSNKSTSLPGGKFRVVCDAGYTFPEQEVVCTDSGQWSVPNAVCQPVGCQEPLTVANGAGALLSTVDGARLVVTVNYSCDVGYELRGERTLSCDAGQGTWSSEAPTCERVSCGQPTNMAPGVLCEVGSKQFFGDVVSCRCKLGYTLSGGADITCLANASWSPLKARCEPVRCPNPADPVQGEVTAPSLDFGATATYLCHPNHTLLGNHLRRCRYDGSWSGSDPTCVPLQCPPHPAVPNGRIIGTGRALGSTVEVTCSRGFELRGPAVRTCQAAAQWTPPKAPVCVPSVCPEPEPGPHALLSYSNTALGSQVGFSCQDGYVLRGSDAAVCGWGGMWAPSVPVCIPVDCGPPPALENGEATMVSGTTYQSVAKYSCRRGFRLVGAGQRTCTSNGTWTDDYALQCSVVTCPTPEDVPHATVAYPSTSFGSIVEYRCDAWFELHGSQQRSCQADGTWSDTAPRCLPTSCATQRTMEHGRIHSTPSFSLFSCDPGFRLTGRKALRCLEDGTWSGELPECVPKNCSLDGLLANGRLFEDDATGETARATCNPRYRLRGVDRWTCLPDGSWKGPGKTECWLAECPPPDPPINGVVSGTDFNISSVVFYHCNPGYNLTGPQQRTCQDTGLWDGDVPTCEPVEGCHDNAGSAVAQNCPHSSCPAPQQPSNGRVVYDRLTIGGVSAYSCFPGYRLSGPASRLCGRDGRWEGREPACRSRRCPPLQTAPEHTRVVYTGFTLGHNATYSCEDDYSPRGDPTSVCQPDGTWRQRGGKFECLRDLCPTLKSPAHGHVTLEGAWAGARAHYACDPGYALHGDATRECNRDGSWSGFEASCDGVP